MDRTPNLNEQGATRFGMQTFELCPLDRVNPQFGRETPPPDADPQTLFGPYTPREPRSFRREIKGLTPAFLPELKANHTDAKDTKNP